MYVMGMVVLGAALSAVVHPFFQALGYSVPESWLMSVGCGAVIPLLLHFAAGECRRSGLMATRCVIGLVMVIALVLAMVLLYTVVAPVRGSTPSLWALWLVVFAALVVTVSVMAFRWGARMPVRPDRENSEDPK